MRRWIGLGLSLALAACGGAAEDSSTRGPCPENADVEQLSVEPALVTRGAPVFISLSFRVLAWVDGASATLELGDAPGEVVRLELPLEYDATQGSHDGSVMNPFGSGATPGPVYVIARGRLAGCYTEATAATSFALE